MQPTAAIIIPDGFEEIEALTVLDILRRGGVEVTLVGYKSITCKGAHNLVVQTDDMLGNMSSQTFECIVLPGGPGCYSMRMDKALQTFVQKHFQTGKLVCAICAAPLVLYDMGILSHKKYTSHPCTHDELTEALDEAVIIDNNLITGIGPGASASFAFNILCYLTGKENATRIAHTMIYEKKFF